MKAVVVVLKVLQHPAVASVPCAALAMTPALLVRRTIDFNGAWMGLAEVLAYGASAIVGLWAAVSAVYGLALLERCVQRPGAVAPPKESSCVGS